MGHPTKMIDAKPLRDLVGGKVPGLAQPLSIPEISRRTGISVSALHTWNRAGKMPAYMAMVCVGLVAQINGHKVQGTETIIARVPSERRAMAEEFLDAIGAKVRSLDDI
jgi:hypothetical protein